MSNLGDHHHAVINAGNIDIDLAHFQQVMEERFKNKDVRYEVLQDHALIALQGPKAVELLQKLVKEDLSKMLFMNISNIELSLGFTAIVCRCGYTGMLKIKLTYFR